jgi:hypothetical protein
VAGDVLTGLPFNTLDTMAWDTPIMSAMSCCETLFLDADKAIATPYVDSLVRSPDNPF